jgi:Phage integrase, N-terminal SAM-like domain
MSTGVVTPLRHRMIEDMNARKLSAGTQRGHIHSCKRFAAFLNRSPDTATTEDIRRFQLHLAKVGVSIRNRNRIMTGLRFLFRVTLRRLDLAAEIYHIREPRKIPLMMSPDETRRLLAVASNLKVRTLLCEGSSMRSIERIVRCSINTVDKLLRDAGEVALVLCDEIWSFVHAKAKNAPKSKRGGDPTIGDCWTWTAIDADSKLLLV